MPSEKRNAFKVGLVTIIVTTTAFVLLIWLSKGIGGDSQPITIRFRVNPNMPTLAPGSVILVGGKPVGKVTEADLDIQNPPNDGKQLIFLEVVAEIRADLKVYEDATAVAEGPPLGGDGLIKLDLGRSNKPLEKGKAIEGADPGGFGAILAALQGELDGADPTSLLGQIKVQLDARSEDSLMAGILKSIHDINSMTAAMSRELSPEQKEALLAKIHGIVSNLNNATAELQAQMQAEKPGALLGKLHGAFDSVNDSLSVVARMLHEGEPVVQRSLAHVESTADKLDNRIAESVAAQLDASRADSLIAKVNLAADRFNESLADLNRVTGTTRDLVVLHRETIDKFILNLKETSEHLKGASKYVLANPSVLFKAPPDTRQKSILDAARNFAEAANRVDDSTARLSALRELHPTGLPADNPDLARISLELQGAMTKFKKAEEVLWKELGVK